MGSCKALPLGRHEEAVVSFLLEGIALIMMAQEGG
jgi:hypothetical protein